MPKYNIKNQPAAGVCIGTLCGRGIGASLGRENKSNRPSVLQWTENENRTGNGEQD